MPIRLDPGFRPHVHTKELPARNGIHSHSVSGYFLDLSFAAQFADKLLSQVAPSIRSLCKHSLYVFRVLHS